MKIVIVHYRIYTHVVSIVISLATHNIKGHTIKTLQIW